VRVALFKNSEVSFLQLLDDTDVSYEKLYPASSSVMASGTMIVLGQTAAIAGSMAAIIVAWLKARSSRKVIITLKDKQIVHLEGYSASEVRSCYSWRSKLRSLIGYPTAPPNSIF